MEDLPGQTGWLYVYEGIANLSFNGRPPVEVGSGEMVALQASAKPIAMNQTVALALHPALDEIPVPEIIEPSFAARLTNWLEKAGIGAAQALALGTYVLSLAALIAIPAFAVFRLYRRRKRN